MKVKRALCVLLALLLALFSSQAASAHELLSDRQADISAILHITPADSPIAGQPAGLYFTIEDDGAAVDVPLDDYQLFVSGPGGDRERVPTRVENGAVAASYTFPDTALYELELTSRQHPDVALTSSLRITRGGDTKLDSGPHLWAQAGLVASVALLAVLGIAFANNHKQILKRSTF